MINRYFTARKVPTLPRYAVTAIAILALILWLGYRTHLTQDDKAKQVALLQGLLGSHPSKEQLVACIHIARKDPTWNGSWGGLLKQSSLLLAPEALQTLPPILSLSQDEVRLRAYQKAEQIAELTAQKQWSDALAAIDHWLEDYGASKTPSPSLELYEIQQLACRALIYGQMGDEKQEQQSWIRWLHRIGLDETARSNLRQTAALASLSNPIRAWLMATYIGNFDQENQSPVLLIEYAYFRVARISRSVTMI